jgi:hypothetical protein
MSDKHPLSASLSGKNAYYLGHCRITEHNPAYAACLDKMRLVKEGRAREVWPACSEAIRLGTCQAVTMRQTEELAGEALYFLPRDTAGNAVRAPAWSREPTDANRAEKDIAQRADPYHSEHVKVPDKRTGHIDTGGFADAINAELKQAQAASGLSKEEIDLHTAIATEPAFSKEGAHKAFAPLAALPGETPRARAMRLAALKKEGK